MPPKKKKPAKKDADSDREQLQHAEAELLALRRLLELKSHEAFEARRLERNWRERAGVAEAALEKARLDTADIKADIQRQHNTTQEQLLSRVQLLEGRQGELLSQLDAAAAANQQLTSQLAALALERQTQAASHQRQVEALQLEFAAMLRDTLDKMAARLEQQHSSTMTAKQAASGRTTADAAPE